MPSIPPKATWTSRSADSPAPEAPLCDRLDELARDRASSSRELVLETCSVLRAWVHDRPLGWTWPSAVGELGAGLEPWIEDQGWRGPAARLIAALSRAEAMGDAAGHGPRELLSEELGLWLLSDEEAGGQPWNGEPLAPGRRLSDASAAAEHAIGGSESSRMTPGEVVLVLGATETVSLALERAREDGREPRVVTGQGGPCADGLRMARRLRASGVEVAVAWDVALAARLEEFDRIWIGTEALDERRFVALAGTELLLRRARELGVPAELIATSDHRLPDGAPVCPPAWAGRDGWLLWDGAPAGVELQSQVFEATPLDLVRCILTESGRCAPIASARDELFPPERVRPHRAASTSSVTE